MTNQKLNNSKKPPVNPDEWTFDVNISVSSDGEVEEVRKPIKRSIVTEARLEREQKNKEKLVLENSSREQLTRAQMASRLKAEDDIQDIFNYANPFKRFLAFMLDLAIIYGLSFLSKFLLLPIYRLNLMILERYKYNLDVLKVDYYFYGQFIVAFLIYFLLIVVATAFYNKTLGKKILGLSVRGDDKFTLRVTDVFLREVILKPLSIVSVFGIIICFFHKKRKTLHDLLLRTLVIEKQ